MLSLYNSNNTYTHSGESGANSEKKTTCFIFVLMSSERVSVSKKGESRKSSSSSSSSTKAKKKTRRKRAQRNSSMSREKKTHVWSALYGSASQDPRVYPVDSLCVHRNVFKRPLRAEEIELLAKLGAEKDADSKMLSNRLHALYEAPSAIVLDSLRHASGNVNGVEKCRVDWSLSSGGAGESTLDAMQRARRSPSSESMVESGGNLLSLSHLSAASPSAAAAASSSHVANAISSSSPSTEIVDETLAVRALQQWVQNCELDLLSSAPPLRPRICDARYALPIRMFLRHATSSPSVYRRLMPATRPLDLTALRGDASFVKMLASSNVFPYVRVKPTGRFVVDPTSAGDQLETPSSSMHPARRWRDSLRFVFSLWDVSVARRAELSWASKVSADVQWTSSSAASFLFALAAPISSGDAIDSTPPRYKLVAHCYQNVSVSSALSSGGSGGGKGSLRRTMTAAASPGKSRLSASLAPSSSSPLSSSTTTSTVREAVADAPSSSSVYELVMIGAADLSPFEIADVSALASASSSSSSSSSYEDSSNALPSLAAGSDALTSQLSRKQQRRMQRRISRLSARPPSSLAASSPPASSPSLPATVPGGGANKRHMKRSLLIYFRDVKKHASAWDAVLGALTHLPPPPAKASGALRINIDFAPHSLDVDTLVDMHWTRSLRTHASANANVLLRSIHPNPWLDLRNTLHVSGIVVQHLPRNARVQVRVALGDADKDDGAGQWRAGSACTPTTMAVAKTASFSVGVELPVPFDMVERARAGRPYKVSLIVFVGGGGGASSSKHSAHERHEFLLDVKLLRSALGGAPAPAATSSVGSEPTLSSVTLPLAKSSPQIAMTANDSPAKRTPTRTALAMAQSLTLAGSAAPMVAAVAAAASADAALRDHLVGADLQCGAPIVHLAKCGEAQARVSATVTLISTVVPPDFELACGSAAVADGVDEFWPLCAASYFAPLCSAAFDRLAAAIDDSELLARVWSDSVVPLVNAVAGLTAASSSRRVGGGALALQPLQVFVDVLLDCSALPQRQPLHIALLRVLGSGGGALLAPAAFRSIVDAVFRSMVLHLASAPGAPRRLAPALTTSPSSSNSSSSKSSTRARMRRSSLGELDLPLPSSPSMFAGGDSLSSSPSPPVASPGDAIVPLLGVNERLSLLGAGSARADLIHVHDALWARALGELREQLNSANAGLWSAIDVGMLPFVSVIGALYAGTLDVTDRALAAELMMRSLGAVAAAADDDDEGDGALSEQAIAMYLQVPVLTSLARNNARLVALDCPPVDGEPHLFADLINALFERHLKRFRSECGAQHRRVAQVRVTATGQAFSLPLATAGELFARLFALLRVAIFRHVRAFEQSSMPAAGDALQQAIGCYFPLVRLLATHLVSLVDVLSPTRPRPIVSPFVCLVELLRHAPAETLERWLANECDGKSFQDVAELLLRTMHTMRARQQRCSAVAVATAAPTSANDEQLQKLAGVHTHFAVLRVARKLVALPDVGERVLKKGCAWQLGHLAIEMVSPLLASEVCVYVAWPLFERCLDLLSRARSPIALVEPDLCVAMFDVLIDHCSAPYAKLQPLARASLSFLMRRVFEHFGHLDVVSLRLRSALGRLFQSKSRELVVDEHAAATPRANVAPPASSSSESSSSSGSARSRGRSRTLLTQSSGLLGASSLNMRSSASQSLSTSGDDGLSSALASTTLESSDDVSRLLANSKTDELMRLRETLAALKAECNATPSDDGDYARAAATMFDAIDELLDIHRSLGFGSGDPERRVDVYLAQARRLVELPDLAMVQLASAVDLLLLSGAVEEAARIYVAMAYYVFVYLRETATHVRLPMLDDAFVALAPSLRWLGIAPTLPRHLRVAPGQHFQTAAFWSLGSAEAASGLVGLLWRAFTQLADVPPSADVLTSSVMAIDVFSLLIAVAQHSESPSATAGWLSPFRRVAERARDATSHEATAGPTYYLATFYGNFEHCEEHDMSYVFKRPPAPLGSEVAAREELASAYTLKYELASPRFYATEGRLAKHLSRRASGRVRMLSFAPSAEARARFDKRSLYIHVRQVYRADNGGGDDDVLSSSLRRAAATASTATATFARDSDVRELCAVYGGADTLRESGEFIDRRRTTAVTHRPLPGLTTRVRVDSLDVAVVPAIVVACEYLQRQCRRIEALLRTRGDAPPTLVSAMPLSPAASSSSSAATTTTMMTKFMGDSAVLAPMQGDDGAYVFAQLEALLRDARDRSSSSSSRHPLAMCKRLLRGESVPAKAAELMLDVDESQRRTFRYAMAEYVLSLRFVARIGVDMLPPKLLSATIKASDRFYRSYWQSSDVPSFNDLKRQVYTRLHAIWLDF
jgi:hypothetical protein